MLTRRTNSYVRQMNFENLGKGINLKVKRNERIDGKLLKNEQKLRHAMVRRRPVFSLGLL